ncbi:MAG: SDR family NAD(P)-dependent oxidoreductase [Fimbriimonadaceae bacterium]|nr:SDR family NAD(P)-dependent oxidoreductase [Fimbriimonadaceae bacterium]
MRYERSLVVGASSGIGREIACQLAAEGGLVAAVARRKERLDELSTSFPSIQTFVHDVEAADEVPALFQEITSSLGGLDLVVYAAGVMPSVGPDEFSFEKDREIFAVNVLGAMAWLDQAAVRFGHAGHGTIVGIGSVAGDRGRAGQPAYNASKAALATYLEALRNRLATQGVTVTTVKPGPVATEMTAGLPLKNPMLAEKAARKILALSGSGGERYLSWKHRLIFAVIRAIPSPIFRRMKL